MALNATELSSLIKINMAAIEDSYKQGEKPADDAYLAFAQAIVAHIQMNAEVIVTGGSSAGTYKVL
ncbi:hypothetical protein AXI76_gp020 [Pseudoalteromonas phage H101]|jgi:hypothetical protein|uniref:Uncharacterized protein n=1 Tax=Pseudoalteromonas phage H101 TaxID=1654919 RepID=A0A0H4ISU1_9CAUD|nr:hypothetical protein AXI76_gp020 [Pseudoalteromonas phage H101]AKO60921.1 hypothetical protein [Pseudoalteromonas phage H101]|tara:strand:+ start:24534 stop:24731 length:198 start_codon:yes stop_codon:yes gene_type:complete